MGFFDSSSTSNNYSVVDTTTATNSYNTSLAMGDSIKNVQIGVGDSGLSGIASLQTPLDAGLRNAATAPLSTLAKGLTNPTVIIGVVIVLGIFMYWRSRK